MKLSKSRSQYHKNGVRISEALYDEIMRHARARREIDLCKGKRGVVVHWVRGMTASVYAFENAAGKVNWAEEYLKAGLIERLEDYKGHWTNS